MTVLALVATAAEDPGLGQNVGLIALAFTAGTTGIVLATELARLWMRRLSRRWGLDATDEVTELRRRIDELERRGE